jgi:DNA-binding NtrC family response regulator
MDLLMKQPWPGNVRELENILVQGILYSKENTIDLADIPLQETDKKQYCLKGFDCNSIAVLPYKDAKEKLLQEFNYDYIGAKLSMTNGNITQAAKQCNMDRQALQQIMKRYGIDPAHFR